MATSAGSAKRAAPAERLDTLPPWPWDILDAEAPPTLGWAAIAWAEGWDGYPDNPIGWRGLRQPNGPRARLPFRFTARQRTFLLWFYALDDDGQWVYTGGRRRLVKGAGKSPHAAVHGLIELCAPVRLETFRRGAPGGVVGRPVELPLVHIAAVAESQTANTMRMVRAYAPRGSHVASFYQLDPGITIYYKQPLGQLSIITSSFTSAEGGEESFVIMDELEHWTPSNHGPQLANTLDDNLAKSGARSIGTCNAWVPGFDSVAEHDWKAWLLEQEGATVEGAGRTLYDAVIAPADLDPEDPEDWRRGLLWCYSDCDWKKPHEPDPDRPGDLRPVPGSEPDIRPILRRVLDPKSDADDSQRKYLNQPTAHREAWCSEQEWAALTDLTREPVDGERVALFFDGSKSGDATALHACAIDDGHVMTLGIWEPGRTAGAEVDPAEVDLALAETFDRFTVVAFFADVREWEQSTKVAWPELYEDQLEIWAVPSGKFPTPIAWDMRSQGHVYDFTVETELVLAEIREGSFTHDGHPSTGRHVANARRRPNRYGVGIRKESPDSPNKIDGCVTMIGSRMVRRLYLAQRKPTDDKTPGEFFGWQ